MSETAKIEIKPHHLRALASDIEDCHNPQSWADYCRAAAVRIEAQAARITELEAALRFYASDENWRHNGQLDPNSGNFTGGPARAALEGKKDE